MVRDKIKDRQNSVRIYDEEGFLQRAACICVKNGAEDEILLVSSSRHTDQWIVPGGGVEPEETHSVAAMREVVEEAGVKGHIDRCLGVFQASAYFIPQSVNEERRTRTVVYVLMVTEEMSEWEDSKNIGRRRKWFGLEEAFEQLAQHKPIQLDYLQHMRLKHKV
ncbi:Diphosphoinositol polyphosphate phosphohydrolase 1 [Folsomia candida]|uniref:diphosphoinositol-polyphosphate diphosphatase n=1 Tax=Folsomia candida TaxID=158441 RepID=A0A226F0K6_FOLCA|nr:Diphosphoinositol polyphosphate phosphohydrolase 1 [Folsomia candida]